MLVVLSRLTTSVRVLVVAIIRGNGMFSVCTTLGSFILIKGHIHVLRSFFIRCVVHPNFHLFVVLNQWQGVLVQGLATSQSNFQLVLAAYFGNFLATLDSISIEANMATDTVPIDMFLLSCLVQVARLLGLFMFFERRAFQSLLINDLPLLWGWFCRARLKAFEETIGCDLLTFWRQHHCRLHSLLLIEVFCLWKHDTLHRTRRCSSWIAQNKRVIFFIAGWFWRQIQHFGWMPIFHNRIIRYSEIPRHQAELTALYTCIGLASATSGVWMRTDILKTVTMSAKI